MLKIQLQVTLQYCLKVYNLQCWLRHLVTIINPLTTVVGGLTTVVGGHVNIVG